MFLSTTISESFNSISYVNSCLLPDYTQIRLVKKKKKKKKNIYRQAKSIARKRHYGVWKID